MSPRIRKLFELQFTDQTSTLKLDGIHPMPPTGGSGANTAVRDAALLSEAIKKAHLTEYKAEMRAYASVATEEASKAARAC
ncbi:hypothetical protein BGZ83_004142 [Gryganskiella cystojenkinii]|nr:hypothetical protein BGZ83_004142 [Gryganskiella cystojenkinii]